MNNWNVSHSLKKKKIKSSQNCLKSKRRLHTFNPIFEVFWCLQGLEKGCNGNKWVKVIKKHMLDWRILQDFFQIIVSRIASWACWWEFLAFCKSRSPDCLNSLSNYLIYCYAFCFYFLFYNTTPGDLKFCWLSIIS